MILNDLQHERGAGAGDSGLGASNADEAVQKLRALGYDVKNATDLERLRPSDEYEQELIVAAEVRAYFQVAYKVSSMIYRPRNNDEPFAAHYRQCPAHYRQRFYPKASPNDQRGT